MKDEKKFWIGILLLVLVAVVGPFLIMGLMFLISGVIPPVVLMALLVAAAAVLAFKGGIGR